MIRPVPTSRPVASSLLLCLLISSMAGCATDDRPPFLTTPAQAEALDRIISRVGVELTEYREGHSGISLATAEEFLGRKDLQIRLILNDEQWNDYVTEQKSLWARSLHNDFFRDPLRGNPTRLRPREPE